MPHGKRHPKPAEEVELEIPLDGNVTVRTPFLKTRMAVQVSILAILAFLGGYFILWADTHNDERYLRVEEYKKDRELTEKRATEVRESDERLTRTVERNTQRRLDDMDKKLDTILVWMQKPRNQ